MTIERIIARDITNDIILLLVIGSLALIASIIVAATTELWGLAIVIAIFSSTAFILSGIEGIRKTIIEKK